MTNDEKMKNVNLRKILKVLIIIFAILTIITAILSLWKNLNPIFTILFFIIEFALSKYREKLDPKKSSKIENK